MKFKELKNLTETTWPLFGTPLRMIDDIEKIVHQYKISRLFSQLDDLYMHISDNLSNLQHGKEKIND